MGKFKKHRGVKMFKKYKRTNIAEMTPYHKNIDLNGVSISEEDQINGSPKIGDMIARNPANHKNQWLVEKSYFMANFEPLEV